MHVLGLSGSLRSRSYNTQLLHAAAEMLPAGTRFTVADLSQIPLYNGDYEDEKRPESVRALRASIAAADALLIASPEYNYSVPGVLKNAIDWVSRGMDQPLRGKPVAIMGATQGLWGTARMQVHLRQLLTALDMFVLNKPEVLVAQVRNKFDEQGRLVDEQTRTIVRQQMEALVALTHLVHD